MTDPVVAPKTAPKPVTAKHLAYELAEQHQLTKTQGLARRLLWPRPSR